MTDTIARVEAVLADEKGTICVCGLAESYHEAGRLPLDHQYKPRYTSERADALRAATYPEALAVVQDVMDVHFIERESRSSQHRGPLDTCFYLTCRLAAAYLAKAQEYVP